MTPTWIGLLVFIGVFCGIGSLKTDDGVDVVLGWIAAACLGVAAGLAVSL